MQLGSLLSKNRKVINIVIIIIALIVAFNIFKAHDQAIKGLQLQKENEIKKNEALGLLGRLDKRLKAYKDFLPKKDRSAFTAEVYAIAKELNVKILSLKPQEQDEVYQAYTKNSFNLSINTRDYEALGKFISRLENAGNVYMVDLLEIAPYTDLSGAGEEESAAAVAQSKGLLVNLKVGTFFYRD